ncbi:hypothetical protein BCR34DRAFT_608123 [Clohesyomyces aquaticus]|uniref:Fungal N-terminal domain-containing protein n=1 Tax=Clohesyomyces aquaticus TaxID=1231657 RepID=A0A1Y1YA27_9PLEO|nr:hypothetical protein BCR34DRAFT_608123 [Clohesyomyces aquaticus]
MDPVSLAASIITLAAAASNTGAALQRLWELKQASENLSVIINEVTEFELVLAFVLEAVTSLQSPEHDRATKTLQIFLDRAEVQIKDIKDFVQAQLACTDVGKFDAHTKPKMKKRGKLKEILGENQRKLEPLRQQLVSTKLGLLIALSAMNVRHISQIPALLMSIQQIQVVNPGGSMLSSTTDNFLPPATRVEEILSTYPLDPTGAISTTVSDAPGTSQIPTSARDDDQPPAELPEETHPPTPGSPHRAAAIPTPPSLNTAGQQSPGTNTSTTILPSTAKLPSLVSMPMSHTFPGVHPAMA